MQRIYLCGGFLWLLLVPIHLCREPELERCPLPSIWLLNPLRVSFRKQSEYRVWNLRFTPPATAPGTADKVNDKDGDIGLVDVIFRCRFFPDKRPVLV